MDVRLAPKDRVWRGRGRPRVDVPPEITSLLRQVYTSGEGQCAVIDFRADPKAAAEAKTLIRQLKEGARRLGYHVRVQHDPGVQLRFEVTDKEAT